MTLVFVAGVIGTRHSVSVLRSSSKLALAMAVSVVGSLRFADILLKAGVTESLDGDLLAVYIILNSDGALLGGNVHFLLGQVRSTMPRWEVSDRLHDTFNCVTFYVVDSAPPQASSSSSSSVPKDMQLGDC